MAKQQIRSDKLRQPIGVFSHAAAIEARGRLVFISGMTARWHDGRDRRHRGADAAGL